MPHRFLVPIMLAAVLLGAPLFLAPSAFGQEGGAGEPIGYLALGDSVASGAELGEEQSYPRRLSQRLANETGRPVRYLNRARDRALSGAVAGQLDVLAEVAPQVVTLTVGANDVLLPIALCLASKPESVPAEECRPADPTATVNRVEARLRDVLERLVGETEAVIVVTTYFNPYPGDSRCAAGADPSVSALNAAIGRAVADFPERGALVDLVPLFQGHEGREPVGWFMPGALPVPCADIHPNTVGHEAIAAAVWDAVAPKLLGQ
jgi:lysophospholipase L1-like esterase